MEHNSIKVFLHYGVIMACSVIVSLSAHNNTFASPVPNMPITKETIIQKNMESYTAGQGSVYGPSLTQEQLDNVAAAVTDFINNHITDGMSRDEKIRVAHDFLIANTDYADDWRIGAANTSYGALINHTAQCSGYSRAFKALCDAMDIPCYYVHADKNSWNPSHQWNIVEFSDGFYHIDVQANDMSEFDAFYHCDDFPVSYDTSSFPEIGSRKEQ